MPIFTIYCLCDRIASRDIKISSISRNLFFRQVFIFFNLLTFLCGEFLSKRALIAGIKILLLYLHF